MTDLEDLQLRLATTLAPMLLTVATFALGAASIVPSPSNTIIDEMLSVVAAFSIFSAALLVDSALDKQKISSLDRLSFLGGGYVCFCGVVAAMTAAVPILYEARCTTAPFGWHVSFVAYLGAGASVFLKLMTYQDKNVFTFGMFVFYVFSIYALGH